MTPISSRRFIARVDIGMCSAVPQIFTANFRNRPSINATTVTEEAPP
jgi:hypothetical protein